VFNWEEGVYEFQIEEGEGRRRVLFSGDISHLEEVFKKVLDEINRN